VEERKNLYRLKDVTNLNSPASPGKSKKKKKKKIEFSTP
jgi:hypothetical protein